MMFILIIVVIEEDSSAPALPTYLGLPDPCQLLSWSSSENFGIFQSCVFILVQSKTQRSVGTYFRVMD